MYIVICVPNLAKIAPGVPQLCWKYFDNIYKYLCEFHLNASSAQSVYYLSILFTNQ
jgi:hypothetical protein